MLSPVSSTIVQGAQSIDITSFFTDNLTVIRRYGVLVKAQDEAGSVRQELSSREGAEAPYLELEVDLGLPAHEILCPAVADTYIDSGGTSDPEYSDWNFNWKTRVLVSWHPTHGTAHGLWQFAIPGDIAAEDIDNATLYLSGSEHALTFNQFVVDCYGLNEPFDEESASWSSLGGGDYDGSVASSGTIYQELNPAMTNWSAEIDVTGLLSGNLDKVRTNGMLLRLQEEGVTRLHQNIASREAYDETDRAAYLKITKREDSFCACDVNGDGSLTPLDALCVFQKYLEQCPTPCGPCEDLCTDINRDMSTTPLDALCVFQEYLGIGCAFCR